MSASVDIKRQAYGKAKVRVTKAIRHTAQYNGIVELTCKNTCYVIAKKSNHIRAIERSAYELGKQTRTPTLFNNVGPESIETRETWVTVAADSVSIKSGLEGLLGLKTTGSSFSNFHLCENTTLQDADDRIFFTTVKAYYNTNTSIGVENISFDRIFVGVRETTLDLFAHEDSTSTQATLCCTAGLILKRSPEVQDVYYALQNSHHFTTNLAHSNLPNAGSEITII
ncbi:tetrahydrobiopterin biosynthesis enzymes-like protein [Basidiobolus meristosporus CBS 931.73]|uniref:factor independent urate hydroxylase n=1 Tax=Basidiobolus meristosporus CBS 931.73 TaxID=1314790 RepID=A0A1Y1YJA4_9FUNG|nr:tetrahydrobiopterin biosynthesis enzymes-like protein [Basidiobolus meristosporus CBS 931.73]|eukprot:ORX98065.1 tetrahydrobiopterin biosynthesis enzymes-like protein [Basidiobolus meristosporus CBS 931.73]